MKRASSGSNLGLTNKALIDLVSADVATIRGALMRIVEDGDVATELAMVAQEENASTIVIGHTQPAGWTQFCRRSLVDDVLAKVDNVAVQLVELPGRQ